MSDNVDLVRGANDALARGDVPAILEFLDPNIQWIEAEGFPTAGLYVGPQAVLDGVIMPLVTEWDGFSAVPSEYIDGGNKVVSRGRYSATYKKTGKSYECDFAHVWELRDGKAVSFYQYVDSALVQKAMNP